MGKKVIVAGHVCLDITPMFPQGQKFSRITDILSPGKLIQMDGVNIHTGGAVSNTGLAMKKMGAEVCLIGKTGTDQFGKIIAGIFEEHGAGDGILAVEGERTSYTVAVAIPGVDRMFLHDPGCNDTFTFQDIPREKLQDPALFHFGYPPIMREMYVNQGKHLAEMMKDLKSRGIATSLDLAMVDEESEAGRQDWAAILAKTLPYVDFFVPSIEEVCWMLDRPRYEEWQKRTEGGDMVRALDPEKDIRPVAEQCMKLGAKVLLLKCGAPGLYYKTAGADRLKELEKGLEISAAEWADQEGFEKSYVPEKVLSGTGAGDTTIGAFLTAMLQGYPFSMCVRLAAAQGACCVASYDALSGLRPLQELAEKIEAGWEKQDFGR